MFRSVHSAPLLGVVVVLLAGCSQDSPTTSTNGVSATGDAVAGPSSTGSAAAEPSETGSPSGSSPANAATCPDDATAEAGAGATCQIVLGTANIFGAGHDAAPDPAGGGPGTLPPMWEIPNGASTMAVTDTVGTVKPVPMSGGNGAAGAGPGLPTDIGSHDGISGIVNRNNTMFLVGVFLTDAEPKAGEHPDRLGFTDGEDFTELAPLIGQTFFIGDGDGKTFLIPEGATRLYLGFADAYDFQGDPGWYGNNSGQLAVTVEFGTD